VTLVEIRRPPNNFFDIADCEPPVRSKHSTTIAAAELSCSLRGAKHSAPAPISGTAAR
jgi:hypothetical protein